MAAVLHFRFKGARNYIQGGDIFDVVEKAFAEEDRHIVGLTFRHFSSRQLALAVSDPGAAAMTEGVVLNKDGTRSPFWLVETEVPVIERHPYDEDAITRGARIEGKSIHADGVTQFSVIEQVIALTKALNYQRAPDVDGKWVFAQLRLAGPLPVSAKRYQIQQKTLLANRFSTQDIILDGQHCGEIRFITGKP